MNNMGGGGAAAHEGTAVNPLPSVTAQDTESGDRLAQIRDAEAAKERLRRRVQNERRVLIPLLLIALLLWPNFGIAKVVGHSMDPTLHTDETLVILKTFRWVSPLRIGDIVVCHLKHGTLKGSDIVKRIAYIQNENSDAPMPKIIHAGKRDVPFSFLFPDVASGAIPIPRGGIILLGDNLMNSDDSRDFGAVGEYEILGKVIHL